VNVRWECPQVQVHRFPSRCSGATASPLELPTRATLHFPPEKQTWKRKFKSPARYHGTNFRGDFTYKVFVFQTKLNNHFSKPRSTTMDRSQVSVDESPDLWRKKNGPHSGHNENCSNNNLRSHLFSYELFNFWRTISIKIIKHKSTAKKNIMNLDVYWICSNLRTRQKNQITSKKGCSDLITVIS
jgi:hypothetical protein